MTELEQRRTAGNYLQNCTHTEEREELEITVSGGVSADSKGTVLEQYKL